MACQNCDESTEVLVQDESLCSPPCSTGCVEEMDSACVVYHLDNTQPSELENINLPNGTSVEEILEKIDDIIGNSYRGDDGTSGTAGTSGSSGTEGTSGTAGTSGVDGVGLSGTYTPTLDNPINVDFYEQFPSQYMRIGDVVTVSGKIFMIATTAGQLSTGITLPIASIFSFDYQLAGTGGTVDGSQVTATLIADETNLEARIHWTASADLEEHTFYYHFTYLIVEID